MADRKSKKRRRGKAGAGNQKAADRLGVPTAEMLVLEDSEAGTRAAAAAGAVTVAVPHRHTAKHAFSSATHIAQSLADPLIYRLLGE